MQIHLIGIGGNAIQGLARYLVDTGHGVTGCDVEPRSLVGLPMPLTGHDPIHIKGCDLVIMNPAITSDSLAWPEVDAAHKQGIPIKKNG